MKKNGVFLVLIIILVTLIPVYAGDKLHRLMHNDHDVLAIGEVTKMHNNLCIITVNDTIVSSNPIRLIEQQLKPDIISIDLSTIQYYGYENKYPVLGDYILVSADQKNGDIYDVAWGAYLVDSLKKNTLSIILPQHASKDSKMHVAALESFLHSDGENTEFYFDRNKVGLFLGNEHDKNNSQIIYDAEMESEHIQLPPVTNNHESLSSTFSENENKINKFKERDGMKRTFIMFAICTIMLFFVIIVKLMLRNRK